MNDDPIIEYAPHYHSQIIDVIGRSLRDQKVVPDSDEPLEDDDLRHIAENYAGRGRFWVCLAGETVIGTVAIREIDVSTACLKCMFVVTARHGQGIGQQLLDHALQFARAQGYRVIVLDTHQLMKRAHRFYERNGFMRVADGNETYGYRMDL